MLKVLEAALCLRLIHFREALVAFHLKPLNLHLCKMGRYVPPALRNKQESPVNNNNNNDSASLPSQVVAMPTPSDSTTDEAPRSLADLSISTDKRTPQGPLRYTIDEVHEHYRGISAATDPTNSFRPCPPSSLNNSREHPDVVAYVILFPGANPKWDDESTIFAKSNLELLPGLDELVARGWTDGGGLREYKKGVDSPRGAHWDASQAKSDVLQASDAEQPPAQVLSTKGENVHPHVHYIADDEDDTSPTPSTGGHGDGVSSRLIPVFQQQKLGFRNVEFIGYYNIMKITYLRPNSRALVKTLEIKFGGSISHTVERSQAEGTVNEQEQTAAEASKENASPVQHETSPTTPTLPTSPNSDSATANLEHKQRRETNNAPSQRSQEAWGKSLSVPWAVIRMSLVARPTPPPDPATTADRTSTTADAKAAITDAAHLDGTTAQVELNKASSPITEGFMDPPAITTHPENDGGRHKERRDADRQRGAWRGNWGWGGRGGGQYGGRGRGYGGRGGNARGRGRTREEGEYRSSFGARDVRLEEGAAEIARAGANGGAETGGVTEGGVERTAGLNDE